jgi:hypothetical protein
VWKLLAAVNEKFSPPRAPVQGGKGQVLALIEEIKRYHPNRPPVEIAQFVNESTTLTNGNRGGRSTSWRLASARPHGRTSEDVAFVNRWYKQKDRKHLTTEQIQEVKDPFRAAVSGS